VVLWAREDIAVAGDRWGVSGGAAVAPPDAERMRWLLGAAGALLVLVLAALAAVPWLVDTPRVQTYLAGAASQALGRPVKFASLSVSAFPVPAVRLRGLHVTEDPRFGGGPFLTVAEGRIRIKLLPLLSGRVELADVTLDGFVLSVVEDAGQWNVATLGPAAAAGRSAARGGPLPGAGSAAGGVAGIAALSRVQIVNGVVHLQRRHAAGGDVRLEGVNLTVAPAGRPDVLGATGEAVSRPGGVRLRLVDATVTPSAGRPMAEAAVKASIDVEADDVAPLAATVVASPRVAGALKGTVRVRGSLGRLQAEGELRTARLVLSQSPSRCPAPGPRELALEGVRLPLALAPGGLDAAPVQARASDGTVSFALSLRLAPSPLVVLQDITVKGVELKPILADYLCQPYAVSGPLDLAGVAVLDPGDPWRTLQGGGRFRVGRGQILGLAMLGLVNEAARIGTELAARALADRRSWSLDAPPDFESITGTYRIRDGVLSTQDLRYESRRLAGAAAGTYRLTDGRMDMAVTLTQGRSQVRARVSGAPDSVVIVPTGVTAGDAAGVRRILERLAR